MKKQKYVYKVTAKNHSVFARGEFCLNYKIGKKAVAKTGRIFAFSTMEGAVYFQRNANHGCAGSGNRKIFKCSYKGTAKNLPTSFFLPNLTNIVHLCKLFWKNQTQYQMLHPYSPSLLHFGKTMKCAWYDTVTVKSLTPIKKVG